MLCPWCNKELQPGYIPNGDQPVQWLPAGKKPSLFRHSTAKDSVSLINRFAPFKVNGYAAEAHYCPGCGLVVAPTK